MGKRVLGRGKSRPRCLDRLPQLQATDDAA